MMTLLAFGAGLIVGWNVLPQPKVVKDWYDKTFNKSTLGG